MGKFSQPYFEVILPRCRFKCTNLLLGNGKIFFFGIFTFLPYSFLESIFQFIFFLRACVCVFARVRVSKIDLDMYLFKRGIFFHMYTHRRQFSKCICWQEGKENNGRKKKLRGPSLDIHQEIACFFFTNFCFLRLFSCNNPLIEISWWTILLVNFGL